MTVFPYVPSIEMVLFRYKCVSLSGFISYVFSSSFIVPWSSHSSIRFSISPVSVVFSDADTIPIVKNKIDENNSILYNFLIISPHCVYYILQSMYLTVHVLSYFYKHRKSYLYSDILLIS